jgi:hypothetical protein
MILRGAGDDLVEPGGRMSDLPGHPSASQFTTARKFIFAVWVIIDPCVTSSRFIESRSSNLFTRVH